MNSDFAKLDLNNLFDEAKEKCYKECGAYRLNFGVYYTPKHLWVA